MATILSESNLLMKRFVEGIYVVTLCKTFAGIVIGECNAVFEQFKRKVPCLCLNIRLLRYIVQYLVRINRRSRKPGFILNPK